MTIVFFGSFLRYSTIVLKKLNDVFDIVGVVSTPPMPSGRHMLITATHVAQFAKKNTLPLFELDDLTAIHGISRPDYLVVAGYGKLIPKIWLDFPKIMPINVHPSLLPNYRGAFPAEWAILQGEKETGVSLVQMTEEFDKGPIVAQQTLTITQNDTRETLYEKLYTHGANLLIKVLPHIESGDIKMRRQTTGTYFYARKLTREDGFVPWELFQKQMEREAFKLDNKLRALAGWPGVWTILPNGNRLKLLTIRPTVLVQLEGKNPVSFKQFATSYLHRV